MLKFEVEMRSLPFSETSTLPSFKLTNILSPPIVKDTSVAA
jgi:hypothetical protein